MYEEYIEWDKEYFWHPWSSNKSEHLIIESGDGCIVTDINGKTYIDATSGALNASCGFNNKFIINEAIKQMSKLMHFDTKAFSTIPPIRLAKKISELLSDNLTRTFYCCNGSEATETAIKMSIDYHKISGFSNKKRVISLNKGYHGSTIASSLLSESPFIKSTIIQESTMMNYIDVPCCKSCEALIQHNECEYVTSIRIEDIIDKYGADNISCIIIEPVLGIGGFIFLSKEFLENIMSICKRNNIIVIFDETMTSFGRTGEMFAFQHNDVLPDILVCGKGITSGYFPLSTITTSDEIYNTFERDEYLGGFRNGHTNSGHATGCAIALAVIKEIEEKGLVKNSKELGQYLLDLLLNLAPKYSFIRNVRGKGLLVAFDVIAEEICDQIETLCLKNGLIIRRTNNSFGIIPPLIISRDQVDEIYHILDMVFQEILRNQ